MKVLKIEENLPKYSFWSAVGSLMYLSVCPRGPDITFTVHFVSQAVSKPRYHHWEIVKRILKYIRGTLDYGIVYEPGECSFKLSVRFNYAGVSPSKSTSGFICKMNQITNNIWFSQKQLCFIVCISDGGRVHSWRLAAQRNILVVVLYRSLYLKFPHQYYGLIAWP
ncbi:hypothetical protein JTB14_016351 [Gonioctena quinquepunctata]|nr:hypothetical protein JTB14_016351 [Gonioctena quinquepunctata]